MELDKPAARAFLADNLAALDPEKCSGVALVVGTAVSYRYGRGHAQGAEVAVVAGAAALAWPLMVRLVGTCPVAHGEDLCTAACPFGGLAGGIVLLASHTLRKLDPATIVTALILVASAGMLGAAFSDARGLIASATALDLTASTLMFIGPRPGP